MKVSSCLAATFFKVLCAIPSVRSEALEESHDPGRFRGWRQGREGGDSTIKLLDINEQRLLLQKRQMKEKPEFVHIRLDPFSGTNTTIVPIDSTALRVVQPGSTVALLETGLLGTAFYYYYNDADETKKVNIVAQLTGSCTIVDEKDGTIVDEKNVRPQVSLFTSHCTLCLTYREDCSHSKDNVHWRNRQSECQDSVYGFVSAAGDLFSLYEFIEEAPFYILLESEGRLVTTGGAFDVNAVVGGVVDFVHDGKWNVELKAPLTNKAACKLLEIDGL